MPSDTAEATPARPDALMNFTERLDAHVEHPLRLIQALPGLLARAQLKEAAVRDVAAPEYTRRFAPPLFNYVLTCLETFLEEHFLERFQSPDGVTFSSLEELKAAKGRVAPLIVGVLGIAPSKAKSLIERLSFQRIGRLDRAGGDDAVVVYSMIGVPLTKMPKYRTVLVMMAKRHLFTHAAGLIDQRFIAAYNAFHAGQPGRQIPDDAVGKQAFMELSWVDDAVRDAKTFAVSVSSWK